MEEHNIFISHSWGYDLHYQRLMKLLDNYPYARFKDYSIPKDDPIHNAPKKAQLKEAIRKQMQSAGCILIMAGVYASYSEWMNIEIELANEMDKKIIAIKPRGNERLSAIVQINADEIVNWNTKSIVEAIRS